MLASPVYFFFLLNRRLESLEGSLNRVLVCAMLEFFLNGAELTLISANLINHISMNWAQFKDPVSHMCLAGAVVACWSLTQEMAGLSPFSNKYFCH